MTSSVLYVIDLHTVSLTFTKTQLEKFVNRSLTHEQAEVLVAQCEALPDLTASIEDDICETLKSVLRMMIRDCECMKDN